MTYPPQNPYDPSQPPGPGQPSPGPQHYTTDADPYSRPDPYGPGSGYGNPPLNLRPGSAPPGQPYSPGPAYTPAQPGGYQPAPPGPPGPPVGPFQPGQAAPPPPGGSANIPLIATLAVVLLVVIGGGVLLVMNLNKDDGDPDAASTTSAEATSEAEPTEEATTEAEPTAEATSEGESVYRVPVEGECIENVTTGFYVVDCESPDAYWSVLKIVQNPEDPDPTDPYHAVAAADACAGSGNTQYYYTDTAIAAGRDWDPEIDSITAIYCVKEV
ncbi:hypothetical protein K3N28_01065 [Glycomyces sp. TRM65418]|uniref:hypothetical protein n=1 Tax=Glycomyces sp. TRM65418 TaxID=2867006 RepID=UPI001CE67C7F|nr:hypothetical protein [Glycomyces sp. TRM65418]MCC3761664.1 hypothetical protein [Glycomyces sp. TRM65418]QZD55758.1 hypothetical protein K3N28_01055 [Glycomyces sp. TRM65418]